MNGFEFWLPLEVLMPLKRILPPERRLVMSALLGRKSFALPSSFILSLYSGMMDTSAEVIVYLVKRMMRSSS